MSKLQNHEENQETECYWESTAKNFNHYTIYRRKGERGAYGGREKKEEADTFTGFWDPAPHSGSLPSLVPPGLALLAAPPTPCRGFSTTSSCLRLPSLGNLQHTRQSCLLVQGTSPCWLCLFFNLLIIPQVSLDSRRTPESFTPKTCAHI